MFLVKAQAAYIVVERIRPVTGETYSQVGTVLAIEACLGRSLDCKPD